MSDAISADTISAIRKWSANATLEDLVFCITIKNYSMALFKDQIDEADTEEKLIHLLLGRLPSNVED